MTGIAQQRQTSAKYAAQNLDHHDCQYDGQCELQAAITANRFLMTIYATLMRHYLL